MLSVFHLLVRIAIAQAVLHACHQAVYMKKRIHEEPCVNIIGGCINTFRGAKRRDMY